MFKKQNEQNPERKPVAQKYAKGLRQFINDVLRQTADQSAQNDRQAHNIIASLLDARFGYDFQGGPYLNAHCGAQGGPDDWTRNEREGGGELWNKRPQNE